MHITVAVDPRASTLHGFARVTLSTPSGSRTVLDVDYSTLAAWPDVPEVALDFLFLASAVYAIDKLVERQTSDDNWTRDLEVELPVSRPYLWTSAAEGLDRCLSFLTGDRWAFRFTALCSTLGRPRPGIPPLPPGPNRRKVGAVCLYSGGLDSLVGAIDWLESNRDDALVLAGHHDRFVAGPFGDQLRLLDELRPHYPDRIRTLLAQVIQEPPGGETTYRSRSLLFIALGMYAATSLDGVPLLIPENGTIALNAPLTPSRRGSCSTRTAHPFYLETLRAALRMVGITNEIANPLLMKTKGEVVSRCLNRDLLKKTALLSVSCAKRGHRSTWENRSAQGCGRCMPCIYRRAALHTVGLDVEPYGVDVCSGAVDLDATDHDAPNDFRACLSFLRLDLDRRAMASHLMASGRLRLDDLPAYSDVVVRAMDEIRTLLGDKAIDAIKLRSGVPPLGAGHA
jgi:hypothetical protein